METVTIPKTEYEELKRIKEFSETRASVENKVGKAWGKYQELIALDEFMTKEFFGYREAKKQYALRKKQNRAQ